MIDITELVEEKLYAEWVFKRYLKKLDGNDKLYLWVFLLGYSVEETAKIIGKSEILLFKIKQRLMSVARENLNECNEITRKGL